VRGRIGDKPGAGLGLPTVEEIATLFGGRLDLSAGKDDRGLRVRVVFSEARQDQSRTKVR
jgi:two-component system sensor histidine kinase TctE